MNNYYFRNLFYCLPLNTHLHPYINKIFILILVLVHVFPKTYSVSNLKIIKFFSLLLNKICCHQRCIFNKEFHVFIKFLKVSNSTE